MQVMLLAAGRSTRLGPIGRDLPKPLAPVCGYPPMAFCLTAMQRAGLDDVIVNLHHHPDRIREAIGDGNRFGVRIRYVHEALLLGTGGALSNARSWFSSEPVLVNNGKVIVDFDLAKVIAAFRSAPRGTVAAMVVRPASPSDLYQPVEVDAEGRVIGLRGRRGRVKPSGPVTPHLFTGIHVLAAPLLDRLPREGESDVVDSAYLPALEDGERVIAVPQTGYFAEHSTPERYLQGSLDLLREPGRMPYAPGPLVGIDAQARIEPGAIIEPPVRIAARATVAAGAHVGPAVVLGESSVVEAGAHLVETVVWPGAVARGALRRMVVTPGGVVDARAP